MINIDNRIVVDENKTQLAKVFDYGKYVKVKRLPACSLGDYFAILAWLDDWGYTAI